jgi:hypothetical protein
MKDSLLYRLPVYQELILRCIESSNSRDQMLVCMDFISLFCERFRPLLPVHDYVSKTDVLYSAYNKKFYALTAPAA